MKQFLESIAIVCGATLLGWLSVTFFMQSDIFKPRIYHIQCPRCETFDERKELVDCMTRLKVTTSEDEDYNSTIRAVEDACTKAVCPAMPTVCEGYTYCGQPYCQPEKQ